MIQENNYITIQGWMVKDLKLKGNELICYALIYGFSQDGISVFSGTSTYIAEWLGIDKRNVLDVLKRLCQKGLIVKVEKIVNGVKLCDYKTSGVVIKHQGGGDETSGGGGDETSYHNNSIDNNRDNNSIEKNIIKKEIKKSYGEMGKVKLSDDEVIKLKDLYKEKFDKAVEVLDNYLASKGDKYKSHYAVMKKGNWVFIKVVCGNTEEPKKWSPF